MALFSRIQLQLLLNVTAQAFEVTGKRIWHLPYERALEEYASFTENAMCLSHADPHRLYQKAYALGSRIRKITGFTENSNLRRLIFFLYRNIGIRMAGRIPGEITVSSCYFSRFYTPEQCALMSYMDSGIIAGLWGGGQLDFIGRITEGCESCTAVFRRDDL
ncbi:MAG: hypothetical protein NC249_08465 [Lachnoclostridium sp.]|nr:hypothetical protein [Lachnoclostridium sp.]